jgi:unsaturated rhamnogalacturonyl hydrolase
MMKNIIKERDRHLWFTFFVLFASLLCSCIYQEKPKSEKSPLANNVIKKFYSLNNEFETLQDAWGPYTIDLGLEAMLVYARVSDEKQYIDSVLRIMNTRNLKPVDTIPFKGQPFGSISFELFMSTGDSAYIPPFRHETQKMFQQVKLNDFGAVLHPYNNRYGMLIDYVQEYASRLAKAGSINNDSNYFEEAVRQFELYDSLVRFPHNGLYSQGLGFLDDLHELSPSAWSRGQGWILRGLVSTMEYLPEETEYMERMGKILISYVDSLLKHQAESGFWHQLVDRPIDESSPETSGTGFIAYYLALALHNRFIEGEQYELATRKAIKAVKSQIQPDGSVDNGCYGPGTIISIEKYYRTQGVSNEPHLFGTTIFALAGEILLDKRDRIGL